MTHLLTDSTLFTLTFADSGKLVIGGSHKGTLQIWDLQNTPPTTSKNHLHTSSITSLSYSPCGGFIASADNTGNVGLWSSEDLIEPMTVLDNIMSRVTTLYPLSDSSHLLTAHEDGSIKLWNVLTNGLEREFKGHLSEVQSLSVTTNKELLMSGDLDGHVIIWSLQKGTKLRNFKDHNTQIINVFFHCSLYIITADREGVIFIKEYKTANVLYNNAIYKNELCHLKVERIDNCDIIAAGYENGIIKVWKLPNMESMTTLQGQTGSITSIHFYSCTNTSGFGFGCLTTSKDGSIFMWDVTSGCQVSRLITDHPVTAGSLNPSSQLNTLVYGCDNGYIGVVWYECKLDEKECDNNIILKLLKRQATPVYSKTRHSPLDIATSTTVSNEGIQDIKSQDLTVPFTLQTESIKEEDMSDVKEREDRPTNEVSSSCPIKESYITNSSSSLTKQFTTSNSPAKDSTVNLKVAYSNNNSTDLDTHELDYIVSNEKENQEIVIENEESSPNLIKDGINISVGTTSPPVAKGNDSRSTACTLL